VGEDSADLTALQHNKKPIAVDGLLEWNARRCAFSMMPLLMELFYLVGMKYL